MKLRYSTKRWLWPLAVLLLAATVSLGLLWTAPQTVPEPKTRAARIVRVQSVAPATHRIAVSAQGPVVPARSVTIVPQVSGRIVEKHRELLPGGFVQAGEELVRIDPSDYQIALTEMEAAAQQAIFEQELERGRQVVASREWSLLEGNLGENEVNRALVLREPHLRRTEALLRAATNEIARARLDLARTSIPAPFNAIVMNENVELGQVVDAGTSICTLAGTDEFWVQATLPMDKLRWIELPGPDREGAAATVLLDTGHGEPLTWEGRVLRLLSDLEPTGRMARVLIQVDDPLRLNREGRQVPLLLGSFVQVQIEAGTLENVLAIPRAALREDSQIWVVDENNELQVRPAEILWSREDEVLIANVIEPGELLVRSELKAPLPGMKVNPQPLPGAPEPATRAAAIARPAAAAGPALN